MRDIYLKGYADGCEAKDRSQTGSPSTTVVAFIRALGYRAADGGWRERMQAAKAVDMWTTLTRYHMPTATAADRVSQRDRKGSGAVPVSNYKTGFKPVPLRVHFRSNYLSKVC